MWEIIQQLDVQCMYVHVYMYEACIPLLSAEFPGEDRGEKLAAKGVLGGKKIAVSSLFSAKDQAIAASVLNRHGGVHIFTSNYIV